jgi:hypothetical protein
MLRDLDGADDPIDLEPPAKPATDQVVVDRDLVHWQTGSLRRCRLDSRDGLGADPYFAAVLP